MPLRKLVAAHIYLLLIIIAGLCLGAITGYTVTPQIALPIIFGFLGSALGCVFKVGALYGALKRRLGYSAKFVFALAGIFCIEAVAILFALLIGLVMLWHSGAKVVAKGAGHEVRLVPAITWPPRYVLYKTAFVAERRLGDVHANDEDFDLAGDILAAERMGDTTKVVVKRHGNDTTVAFYTIQ